MFIASYSIQIITPMLIDETACKQLFLSRKSPVKHGGDISETPPVDRVKDREQSLLMVRGFTRVT